MKIENNYAVNSYELDNYRCYDKSVEEEIDKFLGLIEAEKIIVQAKMFSEKNTMLPKEREKEGRTITYLKCDNHTGKYRNQLKFSRVEKINTEIKKGDICVVTISNTDIQDMNCKIKEIDSNSITVLTEEKIKNSIKTILRELI